jgi:molybdate transport system regulatory protein
MTTRALFRLRIYLDDTIAIGPGKVQLLQAIQAHGSISAAARALDMSYRRAWNLVDEMNQSLTEPAVTSAPGGSGGGGAHLTAPGEAIVAGYRNIEALAQQATMAEVEALQALLKR